MKLKEITRALGFISKKDVDTLVESIISNYGLREKQIDYNSEKLNEAARDYLKRKTEKEFHTIIDEEIDKYLFGWSDLLLKLVENAKQKFYKNLAWNENDLVKTANNVLRQTNLPDSLLELENIINAEPDKFINGLSNLINQLIKEIKHNYYEKLLWNDKKLNSSISSLLTKFNYDDSLTQLNGYINSDPDKYILRWNEELSDCINIHKNKYQIFDENLSWNEIELKNLVQSSLLNTSRSNALIIIENAMNKESDKYLMGWSNLIQEVMKLIKKEYGQNLSWNDDRLNNTVNILAKKNDLSSIKSKLEPIIIQNPHDFFTNWSQYDDILTELNNLCEQEYSGNFEIKKEECSKIVLELIKQENEILGSLIDQLKEVIYAEPKIYLKHSEKVKIKAKDIYEQEHKAILNGIPSGTSPLVNKIQEELEYLIVGDTPMDLIVSKLMERIKANPFKYLVNDRQPEADQAMVASVPLPKIDVIVPQTIFPKK